MHPRLHLRRLIIALMSCTSVLIASTQTASASPCPARMSWPTVTEGFPRRTEETARLFPDRVRALEDYMFKLEGADEDRKGIRTDALIIIHQGAIFYERYARGYTRETPHLAWSVTKTITQMLTGIAIQRGALSIDDSVCKWISGAPKARCNITVRHLLEFGSGIDWAEDYEGTKSRQDSSVIAMLYGEGKGDMARFVLHQDIVDPPGKAFRYSTGDSTLLGAIVDEAMRSQDEQARRSEAEKGGDSASSPRQVRHKDEEEAKDYPWTFLFDPLGITSMTIELDNAGHHVGGAYSYATAEDWARLGYLMLNDGCWNGARILPENWIAEATTPSESFLNKRYDDFTDPSPSVARDTGINEQGRQLWLNKAIPGIRDTRPWPDVPDDAYSAVGHWGQYIAVIPSKDIIVIRSGDERDDFALSTNEMLKRSIAITSGEPSEASEASKASGVSEASEASEAPEP